jgi:putative FmdB family regulatory protein
MPAYEYKCEDGHMQSMVHKVSESPLVNCQECGKPMRRYASGGSGAYVKGTTVGKYYKEDRLRRRKNAEMAVKQFERYGGQNKLVPNVNGEEVETWKDAEKIAKGEGVVNTRKFSKFINEEKASQNSAHVNEVRLKKLKEVARNIV